MSIVSEEHQFTEKLIPDKVSQVRKILQEKHDVIIPNHCDDFIARCVRLKDGNLDKAVKLLLSTRATIANFKQWNVNIQPSLYSELFDNGCLLLLKTRDSCNRPIFVSRVQHWDPDQFTFDQWILAVWIQAQYANAMDLEMQRGGYIVIMDHGHFSLKQAWAIKQWRLVNFLRSIQNGVNGRLKGCHNINQPSIVKFLYSAVQPFLSQKIRKRIHFHNSFDSLHEHVDAKYLPTYLGGQLDPENCADLEFTEKLMESDQFFQDMVNDGVPTK